MTDAAPRFRPVPTAIALAVWLALTLGHKLGLEFAGALFAWSETPGVLSEAGGASGKAVLERSMALVFATIALVVVAGVARRLKGQPREELVQAAIPWVAWAALLVVIWKCFIVYATELVHFGQYALVGALVCWAIRGGRSPLLAFLITFGLGIVDELYQHYVLAAGNHYHWMDWSDLVLDGLGATGGILPFTTLLRLDTPAHELPDSRALLKKTLIVSAIVLLPLTLLDPLTVAKLLGHYRYYPTWGEYTNFKPTHWPGPGVGIPLVLSAVYVLGTLVEPRRQGVSQPGLAALLILAALAIQPLGREHGMPVHEVVPTAVAGWAEGITVDGALNEPAWERAQRLGPFTRLQDGKPVSPATHARVLWDQDAIYFGFECEDPDVWAREPVRDDPWLPGDEVVEVFLDDGGDEVTYFEFEVSPSEAFYDLFCLVASAPVDYNPDLPVLNYDRWDAKGVELEVTVQGSLDPRPFTDHAGATLDTDQGWTVELKIPWQNFVASINWRMHRPIPPVPGERWRLGLYRSERPRVDPQAYAAAAGQTVSSSELRERVAALVQELDLPLEADDATLTAWAGGGLVPQEVERYAEGPKSGQTKPPAEWSTGPAEWTYDAQQVLVFLAQQRGHVQAWSPTFDATAHRPQFFGALEFAPNPAAAQ
ncbi:MAG: VanZ family protein [Planctomycetota bacterium]